MFSLVSIDPCMRASPFLGKTRLFQKFPVLVGPVKSRSQPGLLPSRGQSFPVLSAEGLPAIRLAGCMAVASLYRRVLPSPPAIDFASAEGKVIVADSSPHFSTSTSFLLPLRKSPLPGFNILVVYAPQSHSRGIWQRARASVFCGHWSL